MRAWWRFKNDESGMSYAFVGMGLMAFLSASMLAIDVGMLMTARNQAQNAADAGALGGAAALFFDDFDDRSSAGPAVTGAIAAAKANLVMPRPNKGGKSESGVVDITPADVVFLNDEMGEPTRVQVTVRRNAQGGNAMATLIAGFFGVETVGVSATATAEVSPSNGMTCVKPFTIPDKWREPDGSWTEDDEYDAFDNKGNPLPNPDVYIPAANCLGCPPNPDYTGYNNETQRGARLVIRAATGTNITTSFYFSLSIGGMGGTGGADYNWNIANCNRSVMYWNDPLIQEPGAMSGPTIQGAQELIAKDPGAYWDVAKKDVAGSSYSGQSPRVFPIPLYDPEYYDSGKRNGRYADLRVANWIGFFLEETVGNGIWGRIIPIAGIRSKTANAPTNLFPKTIRLVQ